MLQLLGSWLCQKDGLWWPTRIIFHPRAANGEKYTTKWHRSWDRRAIWRQGLAFLGWVGGGISQEKGFFHHILIFFLDNQMLYQGAWISTNYVAGGDSSSTLEQSGVLLGLRGKIFLYHNTFSHLLTCTGYNIGLGYQTTK